MDRLSKKAGGVFYTPPFIVNYIVEQTVGALCTGRTAEQVSDLRILDPTCGCGAFLLGTYDYLLDRQRAWYVKHQPAHHGKEVYQDRGGRWRLTLAARERILRNCLFGVDIDPGAVQSTKLALVQKMLEDSGQDDERWPIALLDRNIQCGNALAGLPGNLDWHAAFRFVMKNGGFDAVIGNPPYGATLTALERRSLAKVFRAGTTDPAALLMVQARRLTRPGGWNSFIVPKAFTYAANWSTVREQLLSELTALVDAGKVWQEVKLEQAIYFLQKGQPVEQYSSLRRSSSDFPQLAVISKDLCHEFGFIVNGIEPGELALGRKLRRINSFLTDFTANVRGSLLQRKKVDTPENELRPLFARRVIGGKQVQRYRLVGDKGHLEEQFQPPARALVIPGSILVQNIVAHIAHPQEHIKIIGAVVSRKEAHQIVILDTVNQLTNHSRLSSYYLLGLLHSRLVNWYVYRFVFARAIRTMHFDGPVSRRIPIRGLDLSKPGEKALHDRLVSTVKRLVTLHKQQAAAANEQRSIRARIRSADERLNRLVYGLYGLSDAEIALVEKSEPGIP